MPHEYTVDEAENLLYLTSTGIAELAGIGELMRRIADDARVTPATRVLVDARGLELDLPTSELEQIAEWHASDLGAARTSAVMPRAATCSRTRSTSPSEKSSMLRPLTTRSSAPVIPILAIPPSAVSRSSGENSSVMAASRSDICVTSFPCKSYHE